MDREMPKKVDPLLLGVWLVLQASQAPMGGWGPRAEPERGQSCFRPSWGSRVRPLLRRRRGQRALPPGGGKGGRYGVRGWDTSAEATQAAKANPLLLSPTDTLEEPQVFGDPMVCCGQSP